MNKSYHQQIVDILSSSVMSTKDIMILAKCGRTTAGKIKNKAIRDYNGYFCFNSRLVRTESILKAMKIDKDKYLDDLSILLKQPGVN